MMIACVQVVYCVLDLLPPSSRTSAYTTLCVLPLIQHNVTHVNSTHSSQLGINTFILHANTGAVKLLVRLSLNSRDNYIKELDMTFEHIQKLLI